MMSNENDCTSKCKLRDHGNSITAALTKRSIDDRQLAAFIAKTCGNYLNIVDDLGRSAVHMCASVARYKILDWLLNHGAAMNCSDYESGSTPLHRALYYGSIDCAVLLLCNGASIDILDADTRCPLQAICRKFDFDSTRDAQNDVLVWGSNRNYNLGVGNEKNTEAPQAIDFFRKSNIWIEKVALGAYHSLFCDMKGHLYAVGHGKGGRLGIGTEDSLPAPKRVKLALKHDDERIICISVSRQHSLLLTNYSLVFACGVNDSNQLGVREAGKSLSQFKEVVALRDKGASGLMGVIACEEHSIAYSAKCVYVWGTNYGQFGLPSPKSIQVPTLMKLADRVNIQFVEANNYATVIFTAEKYILLYYNDKIRMIKTPNCEDLKSISIVGGNIKSSAKGSAVALKLMMLTETNIVFFWYENTQLFYRCNFSPIRLSEIKQIIYKSNQMLILSQDGSVYGGKCHQTVLPALPQKKSKPNMDIWQSNDPNRTELSQEHLIRVDLQRVPSIDRATLISCDESFTSFAVLQESHMKHFRKPPLPRREYNFKKLYHDTCDSDAVHDVVFHVDGETFAAHKFIIYSRCSGLRELIKCYLDKDIHLNFEHLSSKMFEFILKHIYTNYLPTENDIECIQQSLGPNKPNDRVRVCEMFLVYLIKFELQELAKYIQSCIDEKQFELPPVRLRFNRLRRTDYPELSDVRLICDNSEIIEAHKCVLVARLEYFEMMFIHTWAERSTINFTGVPIEYMEPLIDFLYGADVEKFCKQNYTETFLYNMIIICDQYFNEPLQNVCESLILDKISIRKCGEMLDFAVMYNCKLLRQGCLDFICQNLARVLCYRSIEQCDQLTLKCLNEHYRKMFSKIFDYRQITPFSEAIEDELLLSFVEGCDINLDLRLKESAQKDVIKHKPKEVRNKADAHRYEQEAISTSISNQFKSLNVSENAEKKDISQSTPQSDAKNWSKVIDKKEQKRNLSLKMNSAVKQEDTQPTLLTPQSSEKVTRIEKTPPPNISTPSSPIESSTPLSKSYNLDLTALTPLPGQKLSQKQRKRLSSESKIGGVAAPLSWRSNSSSMTEHPPTPVTVPNAWAIPTSPSSNSYCDIYNSPPTGSIGDPSSFANTIRSSLSASQQQSTTTTSSATTNDQSNSFSKILADERRQRETYERMRNKSLIKTQIEETAIAELRAFYNVDNIDDESITVSRKTILTDLNFSSWLKH